MRNDERWYTHPRFTIIPQDVLRDVARIFTFGATKPHDALRADVVPDANHLAPDAYVDAAPCINAAFRHINSYLQGEPVDDETGISHLAHAIVRLFIAAKMPTPSWVPTRALTSDSGCGTMIEIIAGESRADTTSRDGTHAARE